jgi:hypothetical protein
MSVYCAPHSCRVHSSQSQVIALLGGLYIRKGYWSRSWSGRQWLNAQGPHLLSPEIVSLLSPEVGSREERGIYSMNGTLWSCVTWSLESSARKLNQATDLGLPELRMQTGSMKPCTDRHPCPFCWKHLDNVHFRRPLWESAGEQVKASC